MSVASDRLARYLAAETAILQGQSVEMNGRRLTRADLSSVQTMINDLQKQVIAERNNGKSHSFASFP